MRSAIDKATAEPLILVFPDRIIHVHPAKGKDGLAFIGEVAKRFAGIEGLDAIAIPTKLADLQASSIQGVVGALIGERWEDVWNLFIMYGGFTEEDLAFLMNDAETTDLIAAIKETASMAFPLDRWVRIFSGRSLEELKALGRAKQNGSGSSPKVSPAPIPSKRV